VRNDNGNGERREAGTIRAEKRTAAVRLAPRGADDACRIRVGDYRVVYQIADRILIVYIIGVAHRKDVYRGL